MDNRKLTVRQKKFADAYITLGNATKAALQAGYSKNTVSEIGYENLNKPHIKLYIDNKLEEISNNEIAKGEEVLKYLTSVLRGQQQEQTLIGLGQGEQDITEINVSAKDRIKAAELLGKRYSLFTDKIDISGNMGVTIIDDIPVDDIDED